MRAFYNKNNLENLFKEIKTKTGFSWNQIAKIGQITPRQLYGWRHGKNTIPIVFIEKLQTTFRLNLPIPNHIISEIEMKSKSGKLGGIERIRMYGNPGTQKGRSLGGLHSILTHNKNLNSFFLPKKVETPLYSEKLAEFVGIVLGDGGITKRQICITLHKYDDREYASYVINLIKFLFKLDIKIKERKNATVNIIVISRTNLVSFFEKMNIKSGNKVKNQVQVPEWIKNNQNYSKACIKGLLDTDGCFYLDKHHSKHKTYINPGINFTNHSLPLLNFFKKSLIDLGFHPTQTTPYCIFLRKENDIVRYFSDIGSANEKHLKKFEAYMLNKHGRVPKRL